MSVTSFKTGEKRHIVTEVTVSVTDVPLHGNFELRPLGVAMGNAFSVTRVWRYICKNTIRWPAMFEGEEVETEPSQSSCTAYERVFGGYGS